MANYRYSKKNYSSKNSGHDPGKCALYIVRDKKSGDVKIGISKDPKRRLVEIAETYNVGVVEILSTIWFFTREEALKYETHFHSKYRNKHSYSRGGREWFCLTSEEIFSFLDWIKRSNSKRSYKTKTLSAKIRKTERELIIDRIGSFFTGSFIALVTLIIPILGTNLSGNPFIGFFVCPSMVGIYFLLKTDKDKRIYKTYGEDGNTVPKHISRIKSELMMMNLWENEYIQLKDYSLKSEEEFPEKIDLDSGANIEPDQVIKSLNDKDISVSRKIKSEINPGVSFLEWLSYDMNHIINRLRNEDINIETLLLLSDSEYPEVREEVAAHKNATEQLLYDLSDDEDQYVAEEANHSILSIQLPIDFKELTHDQMINKLLYEELSYEVINLLTFHGESRIREAIALNINTPKEIVEELADDYDSEVRLAVEKRQLPYEWRFLDQEQLIDKLKREKVEHKTLELLSLSSNEKIREAVASCQNTSEEILRKLFNDEDINVQEASIWGLLPKEWKDYSEEQMFELLSTEIIDNKVLDLICSAPDDFYSFSQFKYHISINPNTPDEILNKLVEDEYDYSLSSEEREYIYRRIDIRDIIKIKRIKTNIDFLNDEELLEHLANNEVDPEILEILGESDSEEIRIAVASHPNTPLSTLKILQFNSNPEQPNNNVMIAAKKSLVKRNIPEKDWAVSKSSIKYISRKPQKLIEEIDYDLIKNKVADRVYDLLASGDINLSTIDKVIHHMIYKEIKNKVDGVLKGINRERISADSYIFIDKKNIELDLEVLKILTERQKKFSEESISTLTTTFGSIGTILQAELENEIYSLSKDIEKTNDSKDKANGENMNKESQNEVRRLLREFGSANPSKTLREYKQSELDELVMKLKLAKRQEKLSDFDDKDEDDPILPKR